VVVVFIIRGFCRHVGLISWRFRNCRRVVGVGFRFGFWRLLFRG